MTVAGAASHVNVTLNVSQLIIGMDTELAIIIFSGVSRGGAQGARAPPSADLR